MKKLVLLCLLLVGCNRSVDARLDAIEERLAKLEEAQAEESSNVEYLSGRMRSLNEATGDSLNLSADNRQEINALAREQRKQREEIDIMIKLISSMRRKK